MKSVVLLFLLLMLELAPPTVLSERDIKITNIKKRTREAKLRKRSSSVVSMHFFEEYEEALAKTSSPRSDRVDQTTFFSETMTKMGD